MKYAFFDFDMTLMDTSQIKPYRSRREGISYIIDNPTEKPTSVIKDILPTFNRYYKAGAIAIISSSPEDYIKRFLSLHSLPTNIPICGSEKKPHSEMINQFLIQTRTNPSDVIYIGDSPSDILQAHKDKILSVGVTWGEFSKEKLLKAEPTAIASNASDLESIINLFEDDILSYQERKDPSNYHFYRDWKFETVQHHFLGEYSKANGYNDVAKKIFNYKDAKDMPIESIWAGFGKKYFNNSYIRTADPVKSLISVFSIKLNEKISSLNLNGTIALVATPNSLPEYCYQTDINQLLCNKMINPSSLHDKGRCVFRVYPREEFHKNNSRNPFVEQTTLGIKKVPVADNIIIFDDMYTTGTQSYSMATLLRCAGYTGNLVSLTIARKKDEVSFSALEDFK